MTVLECLQLNKLQRACELYGPSWILDLASHAVLRTYGICSHSTLFRCIGVTFSQLTVIDRYEDQWGIRGKSISVNIRILTDSKLIHSRVTGIYGNSVLMHCVPQIFVISEILTANNVFSLPKIHSLYIDRIWLLDNMRYVRCWNKNMIIDNEGEYTCLYITKTSCIHVAYKPRKCYPVIIYFYVFYVSCSVWNDTFYVRLVILH
jgi:hypothetical protein